MTRGFLAWRLDLLARFRANDEPVREEECLAIERDVEVVSPRAVTCGVTCPG